MHFGQVRIESIDIYTFPLFRAVTNACAGPAIHSITVSHALSPLNPLLADTHRSC